jgi:mannose-1-phosphate guanylyltransferase
MHTTIVYAVMAGGRGTRLWPLSRNSLPKQLLHIDGASLLDHTLARMPARSDIDRIVVTTQIYAPLIADHIEHNPSLHDVRVIAEPYGCNTAAAIAQAVVYAREKGAETVVCVPADHVIDNQTFYMQAIDEAIRCAHEQAGLVLIGIPATQPSPLYGYMLTEPLVSQRGIQYHRVERFHEKPAREYAAQLIEKYAGQLWYNCGIFVGQTRILYDLLCTYAPQVVTAVELHDYSSCPALSFDTLVVECAPARYMVQGRFSWADIGSLDLFAQQLSRSQNATAQVVTQDSTGCSVVASNKLVVLAGVDDVMIIDTQDVLLIMKKDEQRRIGELLHILETSGYQRYL